MIIKKLLVLITLFLSIFLIACDGQEDDPVINFYDANNQVIETIINDENLDLDSLDYPEVSQYEDRQFLYWSITKEEITQNQNYEIYPIYTTYFDNANAYGYRTRLVANDDYMLVFFLDPFKDNAIVAVRIYEDEQRDAFWEISPNNSLWISSEPVFSIYDNKIFLPVVLSDEQGLAIDVYDLTDDDFHQQIQVTENADRRFNEQVFLVAGDYLLVETSEWSFDSFEEYAYVDLFDIESNQYQETLLEYEDYRDSNALYKYYDGGLMVYDNHILMGKPDYLRYNNQPFIYEDYDFSNHQIIERPDDIDEEYLPMSALVDNDYLITKYWILNLSGQNKMLFEIKGINDDNDPIYIEFDETVKYLEIKNNQVFILDYRALRLYVYDLESQELITIDNDYDTEDIYYYNYSGSMMYDDTLLMTYQKRDSVNPSDEIFNFYALIGEEIQEYELLANIHGQEHDFLSTTIIHNDKIYALGTDGTAIYLMVYLPGQTSPQQVIEIEDIKLYNYLSFEKVNDDLVIYFTNKTIVIG